MWPEHCITVAPISLVRRPVAAPPQVQSLLGRLLPANRNLSLPHCDSLPTCRPCQPTPCARWPYHLSTAVTWLV